MPHLWPPFAEHAPDPKGLAKGALGKEVWVDADPRHR
jgi:hypothetical protein